MGLSAASENGRDSYRTSSASWTHNAFQKEVPDNVLHRGRGSNDGHGCVIEIEL